MNDLEKIKKEFLKISKLACDTRAGQLEHSFFMFKLESKNVPEQDSLSVFRCLFSRT